MSLDVILLAGMNTLIVFAVSFILGGLLAIPIVMLLRARNTYLRMIGTAWVLVFRGIPPLVWLLVIFFGVTIAGSRLTSLSAAIVGFTLITSAYLAESFKSGLDAFPIGQHEAIAATGLPSWDGFRQVILPQTLPVILASSASFAIHLLKDTALVSLIGVVDLTFIARDFVERGANGLQTFFLVGLIYLILSVPLGALARSIGTRHERKMSKHA
ncbi:MAG: amino acid ABC transporter permease [Gulosibacter sp.]|uniref:amino acid ABC transporter permease n=1 Tax=Gulosibacter sp. TaxID=2817531 RepID=UPI003F91604D